MESKMSIPLKTETLHVVADFKSVPGAIFDVGVSRLFGNGDISGEGMVSGWAVPEENHNWNDGIEPTFELVVKASAGAFDVVVEGVPLINERCPSQEVTLFANGFRVGYWRLHEGKRQLLVARIEPEQIFWRGKVGYVKCVWFMPNSVRLSEIQDSADTRQLAFCFHSVQVRNAQ
jgi:hypothetical protein